MFTERLRTLASFTVNANHVVRILVEEGSSLLTEIPYFLQLTRIMILCMRVRRRELQAHAYP